MNIKLGRNDACWCGSGRKYKACHMNFDDKIESFRKKGYIVPDRDTIKTKEQIEGIKESSKLNIAILDYIDEHIKIGMSTEEIDQIVVRLTKEMGGIAAPLGYDGYTKSVCVSRNEVVCHGIPSDDEKLLDGDIVNIDVSTIYKGYFSDSSRMYCLGEVSEEKKRLVQVTKECIQKGLDAVKPWHCLGDVGAAVNKYAIENGYTVVREIGGHGIGLEFHEDPWVSFVSEENTGMLMVPGMVFTIEPMVNMGKADIDINDEDGWTVTTKDKMPSAQWEVQLVVTEDGYEILTY